MTGPKYFNPERVIEGPLDPDIRMAKALERIAEQADPKRRLGSRFVAALLARLTLGFVGGLGFLLALRMLGAEIVIR